MGRGERPDPLRHRSDRRGRRAVQSHGAHGRIASLHRHGGPPDHDQHGDRGRREERDHGVRRSHQGVPRGSRQAAVHAGELRPGCRIREGLRVRRGKGRAGRGQADVAGQLRTALGGRGDEARPGFHRLVHELPHHRPAARGCRSRKPQGRAGREAHHHAVLAPGRDPGRKGGTDSHVPRRRRRVDDRHVRRVSRWAHGRARRG